jgi:hypothetical protein
MKKATIITLLLTGLTIIKSFSQYKVYVGGGYPPPHRTYYRKVEPFKPVVYVNIGYGFPNLDKYALANFYNTYKGNISTQTGPITGSIDYRFSRVTSLGVMATYGKVTVPYFNYNASNSLAYTGSIESWAIMFNMVNYFSSNTAVEPYLRTAAGFNNWTNQEYTDASGNKVAYASTPWQFAYQASLGARFKLSENAGFYLEAGYGKYIVNGGMSFKF